MFPLRWLKKTDDGPLGRGVRGVIFLMYMLIIISYRGLVTIDEPNKLILDMRACFWMIFEDLAPGRRV